MFGVGCELIDVVLSGMWLSTPGVVFLIFFSSITSSLLVFWCFLFSFKDIVLGCVVVVDSLIDSRRSII